MVVSRILEKWDALKLYFTDTWINQRLLSTEEIFKSLNDPFMKLYFYFLEWILPKFTRFNQYFQTERVVITDLHEMIISLFQEILLCFLKREYVTKTKLSAINPKIDQFQLIDRQLYLGAKVMSHIDEPNVIANNVCRKNFFESCRLFLPERSYTLRPLWLQQNAIDLQIISTESFNCFNVYLFL
ncbi:uncharacterized protein LOC126552121 [Aphis gossypii]|uniref:uncharacterized protein LOC126552121 n=1 Tax=Aphis gossypii TaxID=80765 RepID=UPI00215996BE|nr:uncharacterized protein LOC126552121 [Aphis gossypii]